jgi:hypothetical protein
MIVERNDTVLLKTKDGRIEAYSRQILASYASVFDLSKCEEANII